MGELVPDILERILIKFEVKDLIRYRSVCKSWQSFISSSRFIKSHLDYNYNIYRKNTEIDKRVLLSRFRGRFKFSREVNNMTFDFNNCLVLGFCNGLLCISPSLSNVLVANPTTQEVKKVRKPKNLDVNYSLCWGFGYDSLTEDYKVVSGFKKGEKRTRFQMLTLKSNEWKVVGDVEYSCVSDVGTLCNGALHWFMKDQNGKIVIVSFDLSNEEFKEIPQPDDSRFEFTNDLSSLEIVEDCLCILSHRSSHYYNIWVLRNHNVEQSWELLSYNIPGHALDDYAANFDQLTQFSSLNLDGIGSPIFMQSLASPHANGIPKRKRQEMNKKRNNKQVKEELSVPESSDKV